MMGMYFDTTLNLNDILFHNWTTSSAGGVVLASFLSCFFTVLFEGLKTLKSYVILLRKHKSGSFNLQSSESQRDLLSPNFSSDVTRWRKMMFSVESVLNLLSFLYGYLLMLLVMTYSVWLMIAVLIGTGVGYFFFQPINQQLIVKYTESSQERKAGHCCSSEDDGESSALIHSQVKSYKAI